MRAILAKGGRVRAYTKEVGNQVQLIAKGGRLVAFYDKQKDQTIFLGQMYGFGDQLMALLDKCE